MTSEINPNFHREMRVTGDVLDHYAAPDSSPFAVIRLAVERALGNLYAEEGAGPTKFIRNRVDAWTMTFRPDPDDPYGGHLITIDAQIGERRLPVTAGEMEAEILRLLSVPEDRAPDESEPTPGENDA